jgi:AcrR family transcriptional regulator
MDQRRSAPPGAPAGETTVDRILNATEDVLVQHGHDGLTMRRIAEAAQLSLGTVSYTFRSKESLVEAFVERLFAEYLAEAELIENAMLEAPDQALFDLVRFLVGDSQTERTSLLFPQLWAMASHNERIQQSLATFYARERDWLERLLQNGWPGIAPDKVKLIIGVLVPLIEGLAVFAPPQANILFRDLKVEDAVEALLRMMLRADAPQGAG